MPKFSKRRSYRKRTRRGKYARKGRRSFQSRVKRVLLKTAETKYYDIGFENEQLYHNCGTFQTLFPGYVRAIPQWFNPWSVIPKGTNRMDRIGDVIRPSGMSVKLWLANKWDRPQGMFRVIVAIVPKVVGSDITIPRFDPFQIPNSGTLGNYMVMPADKDKGVRFLYDRIIRIQNRLPAVNINGTKENTTLLKLWIKRKRASKITFATATPEIVNKPLAIYVIPYEQYSTLNTDNIASCAGFMRMYYKDI